MNGLDTNVGSDSYYGNAPTWTALELGVLPGQTCVVAELTFGLLWAPRYSFGHLEQGG